MNKLTNLLLTILLLVCSNYIIAQQYLDISFPGKTTVSSLRAPVELYACEAIPENYSVSIDNISPFTLSLCTLEFKLPSGINYVGGFSGGTGTSVSSFTDSSVTVIIDSMTSQEVKTLSFDINAGCGVYDLGASGGNFNVLMDAVFTQKNTGVTHIRNFTFAPLVVNYPVLQISERSYNYNTIINYNLTNPKICDTIDREISIKNGGTSPLDSVFFTSAHSASLSLLGYNLGTVSGSATSHRIAFGGTDFAAIGNFDNFLDPGEQLVFRESVKINNCSNPVTYYSAFWGCGSDICQIENTENRIIFPSSSPRLKVTPVVDTSVCYGAAMPFTVMRLFVQNYATNLIDSAKDVLVDIFQGANGFSTNFLSVINSGSISVTERFTGNPIPFTTTSTSNSNSTLCNAAGTNSIGRFIINISKVYAGQEVVVSWRVQTCCNSVCTNNSLSLYDWGYNLVYSNRCDIKYREHVGKIGFSDRNLRHELNPGASTSQVTNTSGITNFEFAINNSYFFIPKDVATDYLRYEIKKPACMLFNNTPSSIYLERFDGTKIYPSAADISVTGNLINVKFQSGFNNLTQGKVVVRLTPNCTGCTPNPTDTISINSFYSPSTCSSCEHELGCASIPISILCSPNCGDFQIQYGKRSYFKRANSSIGYPDNNKDGLPDNAMIGSSPADSLQLGRASYGDAVRLNLDMTLGSNNDNYLTGKNYIYYYAKIDKGANFTLDSVLISFSGLNFVPPFFFTNVSATDTAVPYTTIIRPIPATDSVEFIIELDIAALRTAGYFPPIYSYLQLQAYFHVNKNLGLSVTPCGADYTAFADAAQFTSTTNIKSKKSLYCNMVKSKIDLIGFDYYSYWNTYNDFSSCDTVHVKERFRFNTGTWIPGNPATNFYPNEYRNFSYPDSLKVSTTNSYNLIGAEMSYYRTAGTLNLSYSPPENIMPYFTGGTNSFTFDIKQLFRNPLVIDPSKPFVFPDEGYMCDVTLIFEPNCQNQGGLDTIVYDWVLKTDSLSPSLIGCNTKPEVRGHDRIEYVAPDPSLQPTVKLVRVEGKTVIWDVLVANNSNSDAINTWFGFNNPFTSLTITDVERIGSGSANEMPVFPSSIVYGTIPSAGGTYRINELSGGKDIKFRITANIDSTNCNLDSLVFVISNDCSGYPVSLVAASCPLTSLSLLAQPMLPNLLNSISTASDTISLCDTAEYIFKIENTDIGRAYDIVGNIFLQQNLNFVAGSALIFNRTTLTWDPIAPTIGGFGQLVFNASNALPYLSNGLVGLKDTSLNYVQIKFKALAECNFTSGSRMELFSTTEAACGYNFTSPSSFSNPLHIIGATPSHRNKLILNSGFLSPCYDSTTVNLKVINEGPVNTWVGDSVTIVLPRGIHYALGTYNPVQNSTATAPTITVFSGREYLSWSLNNLVTNVDTSEFTVQVYSLPDSVKSCDANYLYAYTTTQDSVICISTGANCAVKIISGDTTEAIFTYKATTTLLNASAYSIPNPPAGEKVIVSFDINNQGQAIKSFLNGIPNGTTISLYSDIDNSGTLSFSDVLITNKVSYIDVPQGISTYYDTIDVPAGTACKFIAVIDFDVNSCVCNTSEIFIGTVPLRYNEPNDTVCEEEPTMIGYIDSIVGYSYTWTASTNASIAYLSSDSVAAPIITVPNITVAVDSMEYYIEIERLGCVSYDTIKVFVFNNPQAIAGNDTIVCYDSTTLNANIILPALSGTGNLTSYWIVDSTFGNGFAGVVIDDPAKHNSLVNGLYNGLYRFIWVMDNGLCTPTTDTLEVTVVNPIFNAGNDTILCSDDDYSLTGSITSTGFTNNWVILPSSPTGATLSNPNITNPLLQNLQDGIYTLVLHITSGSCNFSDTVVIDVNSVPTVNAGIDSAFCGDTTFNLWADSIQYRRTGIWSVDSTLGNANLVSINNITSKNSSVTFSGPGIYNLIWNSIHPLCDTVLDTVEIVITIPLVAEAGKDTSLCLASNLILYGNQPNVMETGSWSQISGPSFVAFSNSSLYNSNASNLVKGTYQLVWEMDNPYCDSVTDTIVIIIDSLPLSNAGLDDTICITNIGAYTLGATATIVGDTGIWRQLTGAGVTITGMTNPTSGITGLAAGTYSFEWSVSNGVCPPVFDTMELTVYPEALSNAGLDDTICITNIGAYTLGATATIVGDTGIWRQLTGAGVTITGMTNPTSGITGLAAGTYSFEWSVSNGVCPPVFDTIELTVYPEALSNAGLDDTICITNIGAYTLGATATIVGDTGIWRQLTGAGVTITGMTNPTSGITGLAAGTYSFEWSVSNGVCPPVFDTMELTVYPEALSNAGLDDTICITNIGAYTLGATATIVGDTGIWRQLTGAGVTITGMTNPTSGITGLAAGTYSFEWSVSNGVCPPVFDTMELTVYPEALSNAGLDDTICITNIGAYTLGATATIVGDTGIWRQLTGAGVTITGMTNPTSGITGLAAGTYSFEWSVSNGVCPPVFDTMELTVYPEALSNAGLDDTICITNIGAYTLGATATIVGDTGIWRQLTGAGVTITGMTNPTSGITGLAAGTYSFEWSVSNGVCPPVFDTMELTVYPEALSNAGLDDTICITNIGAYTLGATPTVIGNVGVWRQLTGAGVTITGLNNPTSGITGLAVGTYSFEWSENNGVCPPLNDTMELTVYPEALSNAGLDDTICITNIGAYTLGATATIVGDTGIWRQLTGAGVTITGMTNPTSGITGLAAGTYSFEWSVSNGVCPPVFDTMELTVYPEALSNAGLDDTICITNIGAYTLGATATIVGDTGIWRQLTGAGVTITGMTNPTSGITGLAAGTYSFEWSVSNGVCPPVFDTMELTVYPEALSNAGLDDTICITNIGAYTLGATATIVGDTGIWRQLTGAGVTITGMTNPTSGITGLAAGTYSFEWSVSNGVCPPVFDTMELTVYPEALSNAGLDDTICITNIGAYTLGATPTVIGNVGVWRQLTGAGVTITGLNNPTSGITGLAVGTYSFEWSENNGVCPPLNDTMVLTVYPEALSNAGLDDTICVSSAIGYTLGATPTIIGDTGTWTQIGGAPIGIINPTNPASLVNGMTAGIYTFEWSVSNGICPPIKDTVVIEFKPLPIANAGIDINLCTPSSVTLSGSSLLVGESGVWTNSVSNTVLATFSDSSLPNAVLSTNGNYGTYHLIWTVDNGYCSTVSDTVQLKIDSISIPFAGLDTLICSSNTYTLNADPVTGPIDTGTWFQIDGNPSVVFSNINDPKAIISSLIPNDYIFVWRVGNSVCPSVYDTVRVSIYEQSIADAGKDQSFCEIISTTSLRAANSHVKPYHTYAWSFNAAGSTVASLPIIVSPNSQNTVINNLGVGIYSFVLKVDNPVCDSVTDTVIIEIFANPVVDFTVDDQSVCLGNCSNFTNNSVINDPSGSTIMGYSWNFGDGGTSTSSDPIHCYAGVNSYTVSLIAVSNEGCLDTLEKVNYVTVNPLPVAGFEISSQVVNPGTQVLISDVSIGATSYFYDLSNGTSIVPEPLYNYSDTGTYTVTQWVVNLFGCRDSITKTIRVVDEINMFVPNAFTPNDDGDNDVFSPVFLSVDEEKYSFMIFNRWGELLFQTTDVLETWDGRHGGIKVPAGVYVYRVTYKEKNGFGVFSKEGHVTVIR